MSSERLRKLQLLQELKTRLADPPAPTAVDTVPSWVDPAVDAETFDPQRYLDANAGRLTTAVGRRAATRHDPLLFALVYLHAHLRSDDLGGRITFADAHLDWYRCAREWTDPIPPEPKGWRRAFVAPRDSGKSSTWFLAIPLWAAAHGWVRFAAAFADSATQAETHLSTLRQELEHNALLREDFPDLCRPLLRRRGTPVADNQAMLQLANGFVFAARGIDSSNLGIKVNRHRPDLLLLDDVEPDEAQYSARLAEKRLGTIVDAVLPMNLRARVVLIGTVTMPGSVVHQLVKAGRPDEGEEPAAWVGEERFTVLHHEAIVTRPDGTERSLWPAKWSMPFLNSIRHTRSYLKNFANDPLGRDGDYWNVEDFQYGLPVGITRTYCWVDPPVTSTTKSDPCGIAIVGWIPPDRQRIAEAAAITDPALRQAALDAARQGQAAVLHAEEVRLTGTPLARHLTKTLTRFPQVTGVFVEANQGGDLWYEVFADLSVPVKTHTASEAKEIRFARALTYYQPPRRQVTHATRLHKAEEQMVGFPKAAHDDVVDAVCAGVLWFLQPKPVRRKDRTIHPR